MKVFVAHTFQDQPLIDELAHLLKAYGHELIDPSALEWTESGLSDISRLVRGADVVVAILSERPQNVLYELGLAVGAARPIVIAAESPNDVPADARSAPFVLATGNVREDAGQLARFIDTISPAPSTSTAPSARPEETLRLVADSPTALASLGRGDLERLLIAFLGSEDFELYPAEARHDSGYDFALAIPGAQQRLLVEVKAFGRHNVVSVESVRQLAGSVKALDAAGGLMISTSPYSAAAVAFAASNGVVLMTLPEVLEMQAHGSTMSFSAKALYLVRSGQAKRLVPPTPVQGTAEVLSSPRTLFEELRSSIDSSPSFELLTTTRRTAHEMITNLGVSVPEAELVADSVVAYVDLSWRLGQAAIARDEGKWRRHVMQIALLHWLLSVRDAEASLNQPTRRRSRSEVQTPDRISFEDLEPVRRLAVESLVGRGLPRVDADDVAQDVMARILSNPHLYSSRLRALPENTSYFRAMAMNSYLDILRAERRRRVGERLTPDESGVRRSLAVAAEDFDSSAVLAMIPDVHLTSRQRQYLLDVLADGLSIRDIAVREGVAERTVRAVLSRAATRLRQEMANRILAGGEEPADRHPRKVVEK